MAEYQYFLHGSWERPEMLWRMAEDRWEWLNRDWRWDFVEDESLAHPSRYGPSPSSMTVITADQAAQLENERFRWVLYWVWREVDPPAVCRRSPRSDERFRATAWEPTRILFQFFDPQADPMLLDEIDAATADRIIQETYGVSGAITVAPTRWTGADVQRHYSRKRLRGEVSWRLANDPARLVEGEPLQEWDGD